MRPILLLGCTAAFLLADAPYVLKAWHDGSGHLRQLLEAGSANAQTDVPDPAPLVEGVDEAPSAPADAAPPGREVPSSSVPAVDETALRYFARQGDTRRLEAEIARLRALYPDWTPPENPLEVPDPGDPELDRLWALYAQSQYAQLREAIADRQRREPDWQVPPDLLERLSVAEARVRLVNASNLEQYETVVRVAAETPSLLTCSEVDILWRLAAAFAGTERPARSLDVYRYILTNCDDAGERLATVQMAQQRLDRSALDDLLGLERETDGVGEFAAVRLDLAREAIAAAGAEDGDPDIAVAAADLERLRAAAGESGAAADLVLLGWYELRRGEPRAAEDWFRQAYAAEPSADTAQGLALAMIDLARPAEAEELMRRYAARSDAARSVYVAAAGALLAVEPPVTLAADTLGAIVNAIAAERSAEAAQQLGWYAYSLNQFETAAQWFETALSFDAAEEPAAFGLALIRQRLGDAAGVDRIRAEWSGRSTRIAAVGQAPVLATAEPTAPVQTSAAVQPSPAVSSPAISAPVQPAPARQETAAAAPSIPAAQAAQPTQAAQAATRTSTAGCRTTMDPRLLSPQAALARGWCLMEIDRPLEAASAFEVALLTRSDTQRQDAAYGQSLAYLRAGLGGEAAAAAAKAPQPRARQIELETAILTEQATRAFESNRPVETLMALEQRAAVAPERIDLMILRGYAYLELRRFRDAEQVFSAAARAGSREGVRGLTAVREAQGTIVSGG